MQAAEPVSSIALASKRLRPASSCRLALASEEAQACIHLFVV